MTDLSCTWLSHVWAPGESSKRLCWDKGGKGHGAISLICSSPFRSIQEAEHPGASATREAAPSPQVPGQATIARAVLPEALTPGVQPSPHPKRALKRAWSWARRREALWLHAYAIPPLWRMQHLQVIVGKKAEPQCNHQQICTALGLKASPCCPACFPRVKCKAEIIPPCSCQECWALKATSGARLRPYYSLQLSQLVKAILHFCFEFVLV